MEKNIEQPSEVVIAPIHASIEHAKCPRCEKGNLYHQIALGITHADSGERVNPHKCDACEEEILLDLNETYPKILAGTHGRYKYSNRE